MCTLTAKPCVSWKFASDVKEEKCYHLFFFRILHFRQHFSLCLPHTIHSAPKIPTFFHPFTSLPFSFSLLFVHSSSAAPSCPISVSPSLPPLVSSSSSHYFHRFFFPNMSFHRLLPPVSWGRRGGLLVLLIGKLVKLSGTSYYNDAANNRSSRCVSVLPLFFMKWFLVVTRSPLVSSRCCKNTHDRRWWASTEQPRCHERSLETKKGGWYCYCEWIVPLNWLS